MHLRLLVVAGVVSTLAMACGGGKAGRKDAGRGAADGSQGPAQRDGESPSTSDGGLGRQPEPIGGGDAAAGGGGTTMDGPRPSTGTDALAVDQPSGALGDAPATPAADAPVAAGDAPAAVDGAAAGTDTGGSLDAAAEMDAAADAAFSTDGGGAADAPAELDAPVLSLDAASSPEGDGGQDAGADDASAAMADAAAPADADPIDGAVSTDGISAPDDTGASLDAGTTSDGAATDATAASDAAGCQISSSRPPSTTTWNYCSGVCEALWYQGEKYTASYTLNADPATLSSVRWRAFAALDDHYAVSVPYCLSFAVNGVAAGSSIPTTPLVHGSPYGTVFTNFKEFSYELPPAARAALQMGTNKVEVTLGCAGNGDWIVLQWSELQATSPTCSSGDASTPSDASSKDAGPSCTTAGGTVTLTSSAKTAMFQTSIVAPGNGDHSYRVTNLDLRSFTGGGTLTISGTVGSPGCAASFDLLPEGAPFTCSGYPQGSLAAAYDVAAGGTFSMSYTFSAGQIFQLGSEGNWFSTKGTTNTVQITATVTTN